MNQIKKEDYTLEKFKRENQQNSFNIQNEKITMQEITEEHKHFGTNMDMLGTVFKNQISHTTNLTVFENTTLIYVYALTQINTRYRLD